MYAAIYNKNGTLAHSNECTAAFGRKDKHCPRCVELLNGSPARAGWQANYYAAQSRMLEMRRHVCNSSKCGPICTNGDW